MGWNWIGILNFLFINEKDNKDYHNFPEKNYSKPELQKKIFIQQMKHAINLKKPIIIHTR